MIVLDHKKGGNTMNTQRAKADREYKAALEAVKATESGTDEAAWNKANAVLDAARTALISAEMAYPTFAETKRSNRVFTLRNRGLDI